MKPRSTGPRDRKIAAATRTLQHAALILLEAAAADEKLEPVDQLGMYLARAIDGARGTARDLEAWQNAARLRRRDHDRAVAAEQAAGGPEAYARQRGLA